MTEGELFIESCYRACRSQLAELSLNVLLDDVREYETPEESGSYRYLEFLVGQRRFVIYLYDDTAEFGEEDHPRSWYRREIWDFVGDFDQMQTTFVRELETTLRSRLSASEGE